RVADELLDDAPEPFDRRLDGSVVLAEDVADVLGVGAIGSARVADQIGEKHRDHLALLLRRGLCHVRAARGAIADGPSQLVTARRACQAEARPASNAESCILGNVCTRSTIPITRTDAY